MGAEEAIQLLTSGLAVFRLTGSTQFTPVGLSLMAKAYADLGQFVDAWRCVGAAETVVKTTGERWWEAEISRIAGEIALLTRDHYAAKAEVYFNQAIAVARQQQAKSWELRAAMSLARLWRDQGKPQQARELLAPVYGWFTGGLRHARSERSQSAARRTSVIRLCPRHFISPHQAWKNGSRVTSVLGCQ